jgi:hypothetical protein
MTLVSLEGYARALNVDAAELLSTATTSRPPSPSERVIVRLVERLREKDTEFVKQVESFVSFLERSLERADSTTKRR